MLTLLRSLFREMLSDGNDAGTAESPSVQLAMASLLCEVSRADNHYDAKEEAAKIHQLTRLLDIDENAAKTLLTKARNNSENAVSLFGFTNKLRAFSQHERYELIQAMWQVAYADGKLDPQEEAVIRQVADLIYLDHPAFIKAKLTAQPNT